MSLPISSDPIEKLPVAFTARGVAQLIDSRIGIALPKAQLESAEVAAEYVQPLIFDIEKYFLADSIMFDLMACRHYYLAASNSGPPSTRKLLAFKAVIAEVVACHISHDLDQDQLARALVYDFYPFNQGTSTAVNSVPEYLRASALELAIQTEARDFLMEEPVAETVNCFWDGQIAVDKSPRSTVVGVHRNNRSRSPGYHYVMQLVSSAVYLVLYLLLIQENPRHPSSVLEGLFGLWSLGYFLDEYNQMVEFGPRMYYLSLWNWIDSILLLHSVLYFATRLASEVFAHFHAEGCMVARGILVTAGVFIVPRLFSVFDSNKMFSNMVVSLQRVSSDLIVSWCVVMMFSVGVWVAVAFSVPRVRLYSSNLETGNQFALDQTENGGRRTALAMFKMLFGDNDSLWDRWFAYTTFDRIALGFYLILAQFVMPTVVTAVLASSFANIQKDSEQQFYYMRATQTLLKLKSNRKQSASSFEVTPFNIISWTLEWLHVIIPARVYNTLAHYMYQIFHFPGDMVANVIKMLVQRRKEAAKRSANARKERLEAEVDRTMGESAQKRSKLANAERRMAKFSLVNESFKNKRLTQSYNQSAIAQTLSEETCEVEAKTLLSRITELEASNARIEDMLASLVKKS